MTNIGIYDDRLIELDWANKVIKAYLDQNEIHYQIFLFDTEEKLKYLIYNRKEVIDIIFLDIQLNGSNGLDIARWLNEKIPTCHIIFLTNYAEYFMDAYSTEHSYYVLKSELNKRIGNIFEKIQNENKRNSVENIIIESTGRKVVVKQNTIMYLEREKRLTHIHCENQLVSTYQSFEEILPSLNKDTVSFVQCHKSYIVSLSNIGSYAKKDFILNNGISIPISRRYREEVSKEFFEWASRVGRN